MKLQPQQSKSKVSGTQHAPSPQPNEAIASIRVDGVLVPVVRVVADVVGDPRVITSSGADGQRLQTTYQRRG